MEREHSRREVLRAGGLVAGGALLASGMAASPAGAAPAFVAVTAASRVAARTDRRPLAGGVYDPTVNRTFICWGGRSEDTYVQSYDHGSRVWSAPVRVVGGRGDAHNYPTMVQASDGRLLIFIGMHNAELVMARSAQPRSIAGTWAVRSIAEGRAASYPMPFKTANGTLFVLFRETTQEIQPTVPVDTRPILYVRSTDNGATWRSSKQLTGLPYALGTTDRSDNLNEVYIGQLRYQAASGTRPERVHLVWTIAGGGPDAHLHDNYHKNIYYATFEPASLRFRNVSGTDLGQQLGGSADVDRCRVVLTPLAKPGGAKSPDYIQLVGVLDSGRPFVMWMTYDSNLVLHNVAAVWNGSAWQTREVARGLRTRETERVGPTTWRVYTTREGLPNVGTYLLEAGQGWSAETTITTRGEVQRIEVVTGRRDPARIIATGASSDRDVSVADGDVYVAGIPTA